MKDAVVEHMMWQRAQEEMHRRMREFTEEQRQQAEARDLSEALRKEFPNARQCGRCGFGPVDHVACFDLGTHHHEQRGRARINNACPRCSYFSRDVNDWPRWDGRLPDNQNLD